MLDQNFEQYSNLLTDSLGNGRLEAEVDGCAAKGDGTIEGVVFAADGLLSAASSADGDNGDRRASYANRNSRALEDDTEEAEERRDRAGARRLN